MKITRKLPSLAGMYAEAANKLRIWLEEYQIEEKLKEIDEELFKSHERKTPSVSAEQVAAALDVVVAPYDQPVEAGQIRLLAPHLTPGNYNLVYVSVYGTWVDDTLLVAPFSRFSTPATAGELLYPGNGMCVRVLEVWNTRNYKPEDLQASWLVDTIDDDDCKDAYTLFEAELFGAVVPPEFSRRVGVPITHPQDPRREYVAEEKAMLDLVPNILLSSLMA
jgi:hypothetical protein